MDTNTKPRNKDVDTLLQKALSSDEKPDQALLMKVKSEMQKKEDTPINKSKMKRSFRRVAAVVAATLALTTTVFAAGAYLGSFDRLRDVVGSERAEVLQPLEIANIPEAQETQYYEAVDSENLNTPESCIRVELVAVGVFDNIVDIYVTLEDLEGRRLDDYFQVRHSVAPVGMPDIGVLSMAPEIISRTSDGVVTVRSREIFTHSVAGMELVYNLHGIAYNITNQNRPEFVDLGLDFTAATAQPTMLFKPDASPSWSGGGGLVHRGTFEVVEAQMITEGFAVLQPHLHDIEVDINGETIIISSMGIVEDRLHVQIYNPIPEMEHPPGFMFFDPAEESATMSFGFSKDDNGSLVRAEVGQYGFEAVQYLEFIMFDIDLARLGDYVLRGAVFGPASDNLQLYWSATFEVEANDAQIVVEGLNVQYGAAIITEVRVTPFLVQLVLDGDVGAGAEVPALTIQTTGEAVYLVAGMSFSGFGMGNFFYDMVYLDLDTIQSIEIAGEVIVLK
ncbi:MAG: hypothetical protein FWE42_01795 [Defluviitaleaceae bacterium]|nr:hypothetical protein [Defluviitaleaceae bacterium]